MTIIHWWPHVEAFEHLQIKINYHQIISRDVNLMSCSTVLEHSHLIIILNSSRATALSYDPITQHCATLSWLN